MSAKLWSMKATYEQGSDDCDDTDMGQEIEILAEDGGAGKTLHRVSPASDCGGRRRMPRAAAPDKRGLPDVVTSQLAHARQAAARRRSRLSLKSCRASPKTRRWAAGRFGTRQVGARGR